MRSMDGIGPGLFFGLVVVVLADVRSRNAYKRKARTSAACQATRCSLFSSGGPLLHVNSRVWIFENPSTKSHQVPIHMVTRARSLWRLCITSIRYGSTTTRYGRVYAWEKLITCVVALRSEIINRYLRYVFSLPLLSSSRLLLPLRYRRLSTLYILSPACSSCRVGPPEVSGWQPTPDIISRGGPAQAQNLSS